MAIFSTKELGHLLALPNISELIATIDKVLLQTALAGKPYLDQPLERVLTAPGKRLRPLLVCAIAHLYEQPLTGDVLTAATAVELAHIGSLVHDDIIDQADQRWGRPTIHAHEGLASAIVVGDHLLTRAAWQAAHISAEAALLVTETISKLCDGELAESLDAHNTARTQTALLAAVDSKTGALLSAACQLGCLVANAPHDERAAWANYGLQFGRAFQLVDDVLDFISTPALFGKPVHNDVREGVYTLPVLLSLSGPSRKETIARLEHPDTSLTKQMLENGSIEQTIVQARGYAKAAKNSLKNLKPNPLANLPEDYVERALERLVADEYKQILGI
jgi:heptaprenyl diphosphate synthase